MAEKAKGWTDAEKVGLFLQIIARAGPVPWSDIKLPEGRTEKACRVMVDKEKAKDKKAREAAGEDLISAASPNKRKAAGTEGGKAKKAKGKAADADDEDQDDKEIVPEKKAKGGKKGTKKKAVKQEDAEDDDE